MNICLVMRGLLSRIQEKAYYPKKPRALGLVFQSEELVLQKFTLEILKPFLISNVASVSLIIIRVVEIMMWSFVKPRPC